MNTTHQNMHLPHKLRRELQQDTRTYIESVGKTDINTLADVMSVPDGKGTILRLIMGATVQMPLRAITYASSALHCATLVPCEQLQIIHANKLGERINGIDPRESRRGTVILARTLQNHVEEFFPLLSGKVLHAEDTDLDVDRFADISERALLQHPTIAHKLLAKSSKHGGDARRYAAGHFAFQDTDILELAPLHADAPSQVAAERIVSIGCQQERNFYLARMAMRHSALETDAQPLMVDTAQLFTRHLTPPYFMARDGEPSMEDTPVDNLDLASVGDVAARRDLAHFLSTNQIGAIQHV